MAAVLGGLLTGLLIGLLSGLLAGPAQAQPVREPALRPPDAPAAPPALAAEAAALVARRAQLQPALRASAFGEPLVLFSREGSEHVEGGVYAEIERPAAALAAAFQSPDSVCELLSLHLNVRGCERAASLAGAEAIELVAGPKRGAAAGLLYSIRYTLRVEGGTAAGYLRAVLSAAKGPVSTRDHRIVVEVVPVDAARTFVRLGYGYSFGTRAKIAMSLYLATAGRDKIGFSVVGREPDGQPRYVRGERASLERNVMRYHLALLAYSGVTGGTPAERLDARLRAWFALTERHAPQLRELTLQEYLAEKAGDRARRATAPR